MSLRRKLSKLSALFHRSKPADDLEEEIRAHLEMEERENLESGMSPEEAHYAAVRRFGNVTLTQERSREMWRWSTVETLWQDLGYGVRQLRRSPGFATVAILTLALGVGANTAIFSVINAVLLTPLPVKNPKELIQLVTVGPYGVGSFSYPALKRFRDENHECSEMAAIGWLSNLDAAVDGQPETVEGRIVSGNFFPFLGVSASAGRTFTGEDEKTRPTSAVAVISYAYWKRRFGLSSTVVGRSITLNRTVFTIVGVAPAGFSGIEIGYSPDIYVPMTMEPAFHDEMSWLDQPDYHWLRIVARLKPGVSRERAGAELAVIHRQVQAGMSTQGWSPAERNDLLSTRLEVNSAARGIIFGLPEAILRDTLHSDGDGRTGPADRVCQRCPSLAGPCLRAAKGDCSARGHRSRPFSTDPPASDREHGARGWQRARWASLCAYWASAGIVALMSVGRDPLFLDVRPDPRVLGFTGAMALLATVLFGLAPALRGTRVNLAPALKEGAGGFGRPKFPPGIGKGSGGLAGGALTLAAVWRRPLCAHAREPERASTPASTVRACCSSTLIPPKAAIRVPP